MVFNKIRGLTERKRKLIFWSVIIIIGMALAVLYAKDARKIINSFKAEKIQENLKLPAINFPKVEMPQVDQEELRFLEDLIKAETEKQKTDIDNVNDGQKSATTTE